MGLREYKAKRNFRRTAEPAGKVHKSGHNLFVIQKHDASRLHYDFRLEMEGVLKSWAVPKGLPVKKGDRRLAVEVEDHPLDYADFEGTIPAGNYGAGTVMVWDTGTYTVTNGDGVKALRSGKILFELHGQKLKGAWTLVRMKPRGNEDKPQWLILKSDVDLPELSDRTENESVLTHRTMEEIAGENDRQWQSNRSSTGGVKASSARAPKLSSARRKALLKPPTRKPSKAIKAGKLPSASAGFVEPMKALLVDALPRGDDWTYELKFDGIRALGIKDGKRIQLLSRAKNDLSERYGPVLDALRQVPAKSCILDGEVVAVDDQGRSSFQLLQSYLTPGSAKPPLFYYVFDALQRDGKSLLALPLSERKNIARELVEASGNSTLRFSASIQAGSAAVMKEMQSRGLEGLIAKRADSPYEPGRRSGHWVKFKWTVEQEFVIGGFSPPRGTREFFGALLVGYFEGDELYFAAKVGTGFNHKLLGMLHHKFQKLIRKDCPFVNLPEKLARGGGLGVAEMRRCTWLEPKLVAQIRFAEWTRDDHLRQPAFMGLREDKRPREVVRERPKHLQ